MNFAKMLLDRRTLSRYWPTIIFLAIYVLLFGFSIAYFSWLNERFQWKDFIYGLLPAVVIAVQFIRPTLLSWILQLCFSGWVCFIILSLDLSRDSSSGQWVYTVRDSRLQCLSALCMIKNRSLFSSVNWILLGISILPKLEIRWHLLCLLKRHEHY